MRQVIIISVLIMVSFHIQGQLISSEAKSAAKEEINEKLKMELNSIFTQDQQHRTVMDSVMLKYGESSKEFMEVIHKMELADSLNCKRIEEIINEYGWPGISLVGKRGNATVFLVIQHANYSVQKKYLPLLRESVKAGESAGSNLAYLEDRVALLEGKMQIYGTQIKWTETGEQYLDLLEDPDNVDKRRASVGLGPIAEYLKQFQVNWDVEKFKKEQSARIGPNKN